MRSRWEAGYYSSTSRKCDGGTEKVRCTGRWLSRGKAVGVELRQIRVPLTPSTETSLYGEVTDTTLPGKAPKLQLTKTVP